MDNCWDGQGIFVNEWFPDENHTSNQPQMDPDNPSSNSLEEQDNESPSTPAGLEPLDFNVEDPEIYNENSINKAEADKIDYDGSVPSMPSMDLQVASSSFVNQINFGASEVGNVLNQGRGRPRKTDLRLNIVIPAPAASDIYTDEEASVQSIEIIEELANPDLRQIPALGINNGQVGRGRGRGRKRSENPTPRRPRSTSSKSHDASGALKKPKKYELNPIEHPDPKSVIASLQAKNNREKKKQELIDLRENNKTLSDENYNCKQTIKNLTNQLEQLKIQNVEKDELQRQTKDLLIKEKDKTQMLQTQLLNFKVMFINAASLINDNLTDSGVVGLTSVNNLMMSPFMPPPASSRGSTPTSENPAELEALLDPNGNFNILNDAFQMRQTPSPHTYAFSS